MNYKSNEFISQELAENVLLRFGISKSSSAYNRWLTDGGFLQALVRSQLKFLLRIFEISRFSQTPSQNKRQNFNHLPARIHETKKYNPRFEKLRYI
jgi:hypothetical protein